MSKKAKFYAEIQDGVLNFQSPEWVKERMEDFNDKKITVTIEEYFGQRSSSQNRYLHGIVIPSVFEGLREAGFDEVEDYEDAKTVIKGLFLKKKVVNKTTGEVITEIVQDTHKLSKKEMVEFIDKVVKWASEYLNITIPAPGEQAKIFQIESHG